MDAKKMRLSKKVVKSVLPSGLLRFYYQLRLSRLRRDNRSKPIKEVFTNIYAAHQWGGEEGNYCSGSGSNAAHASRYAAAVNLLIKSKGIETVVDLGCGDFTVGKAISKSGIRYIGIDIVDGLIKRNQEKYSNNRTEFMCLDIVADTLPEGDLCMIRQVLQHLSNAQIASVLEKTRKYRWVIVTEHYPAPFVNVCLNIDKPHGPDTRLLDDSAVYIDRPPFNVRTESITLVLDTDAETYIVHQGERIKTFLIENELGELS